MLTRRKKPTCKKKQPARKKVITGKSLLKNKRRIRERIAEKCPSCFKPLVDGFIKVEIKHCGGTRFLESTVHCTRKGCIAKGTEKRTQQAISAQDAQRAVAERKRAEVPNTPDKPKKLVRRSLSRPAKPAKRRQSLARRQ